ncbi:MAG: FAD-dependent oxidoreductase [Variovorax sp.]|nr:FAD-dependent oxidoreductase [Variovorax sp.]
MDTVDCVVIGAGVVGLAIARALALAGREVVVLEAEDAFGTQTSARNSEVIHAGLSYPAGSLKARLCVAGKEALYDYCAQRGVGHRRIGKLIVAADEGDLAGLDHYIAHGRAAGVNDLQLLSRAELAEREPAVCGVAAVFSPSTGIIDSHALMLAYLGDAQNAGATLIVESPVLGGQVTADGIVLRVGGKEPSEVLCRTVINAAGLHAHAVAAAIAGIPRQRIPPVHYAIGRYYTMTGRSPFQHLVYPVSREATLRVHVTLDLAGQCKFGPDLRWIDTVDYRFDDTPEVAAAFYAGIRRYYPELRDGALQPGYTGIRPRLAGPDDPLHSGAADFMIQDAQAHGAPGLVHLFGIESPGLTASLAIGAHVASLV